MLFRSNFEIFLFSEEGDSYGPIKRQVQVKATGPQSYASAQSYVHKYFLRQLFCIPTGEADADAHDKQTLPDVKPQIEKLSEAGSANKADEAIDALYEVTSFEGLDFWKANYKTLKRELLPKDTAEVTKVFKEVETKLKEEADV